MAKIYVKFNTAVIKEVPFTKDELTFGRKPSNDIVIDHPTISGFHGKIRKEGDKYIVEDLNSTNGTFINGQRTKGGTIKDRDQIGVAGHILEFHIDNKLGAPSPKPAPVQEAAATPALEAAHDAPAAEAAKPAVAPSPDLEKQKEILRKSLGLGADGKPLPLPEIAPQPASNGAGDGASAPSRPHGVGIVKIVAGGVNGQSEIHLKDMVTYIGTTDQAIIKIKGFLAPSLAAAISKRPEGYFLKAVKAGYPKVNGNAVQEQIFLENGALIEVGGTNMVFYNSDAKKAS